MKYNAYKRYSIADRKDVIKQKSKKVGELTTSEAVNNFKAFEAFLAEAMKAKRAGRNHYSARTIIHVLRHYSAVEDKDTLFKINDHLSKPFALVAMELIDELGGLFELRSSNNR